MRDYHALNALLNLYTEDGRINFEADRKATREFFLQHVNQNTVFFHSLREKLDYLLEENYYEQEVIDQYSFNTIKSLFKRAYSKRYRFQSFFGAFKYYTSYTLKTFDGKRYLERFEDRVCMVAMTLARGDKKLAEKIVDEIMAGRLQPATPTFLNAGKKQRGEMVSCFLVRVEDNMESISRSINAALQLSKRGGGVALLLTNIRGFGAPIKKIENQSSGVIPVMKLLEDAFTYANQLGARDGAGAVYLHAHHPDILRFLDTKRENADEKIRIKSLSLGVVVSDITMQLAAANREMALFCPYDVERVYGMPMADISITEKYDELLADTRIKKTFIKARDLFKAIAEIQFESGYPYIMFEDTVNRASAVAGRINMSNLCSEILQVNEPSILDVNLDYNVVGKDISCNLASQNVYQMIAGGAGFGDSVEVAVRALTAVSELSDIACVPSIAKGNNDSHAIGLGQMNLHGFFGSQHIYYGSEESVDFTDMYFTAITYHAIRASNLIAQEKKTAFKGFENSKYADGSYFDKYIDGDLEPKTEKVRDIFAKAGIALPTREDWIALRELVIKHGIYNQNLQAVPPTGSISYINNSTSSIHPIAQRIEKRKEGKTGLVYYAAPHMTDENKHYYQDAYEIGPEKIIDVYAAATKHVDQGLSLTLFMPSTATTRTINRIQAYAWHKGIKTIYYIRIRQEALAGTEMKECVSCSL